MTNAGRQCLLLEITEWVSVSFVKGMSPPLALLSRVTGKASAPPLRQSPPTVVIPPFFLFVMTAERPRRTTRLRPDVTTSGLDFSPRLHAPLRWTKLPCSGLRERSRPSLFLPIVVPVSSFAFVFPVLVSSPALLLPLPMF